MNTSCDFSVSVRGGTSEGRASVCVSVRVHVVLLLPLAVQSLAAALGPQTEALAV